MIPRHLCFAIALSILIAGCATTPRVFLPGPETNLRPAAETAGVLQNTRLDGGYIYLLPVVDRRKAGPEDFGRSEGTLLALKGASVPELVTQYTAAKLRRAGFSVQVLKPGQTVPKNDKFCPLVLSLTIDRFWVLAEPIAYDGVAERYRYFISLNATMRSPKENIAFFENRNLNLTAEVARDDIDPFVDHPPNNEYLKRLHRTALHNLFTIQLREITANLWDLIRTQSWCPALRDDPVPEPFYE